MINLRIITLMIIVFSWDALAFVSNLDLSCPVKKHLRQHSSLLAINSHDRFKKKWRKTDIPPLHASTFVNKGKASELSDLQGFELDLFEQKLHYEELINGTSTYAASIHILEDLESTMIMETKSGLNKIWYARLLLVLSAALYGTNFTFVKVMNENLPVQDGNILRFLVAALATLPWLFQPVQKGGKAESIQTHHFMFLGDILPVSSKRLKVLLTGFDIGCWTGLGYVAQAFGLETTRASTSAFICSLAVVIVPILDWLSGKKPSSRTVIGSLVAVIGVALLELDGIEHASFINGDFFNLLQPFAFGIGFWRLEHAMKRYPEEAMKLTAMQLLTTAVLSILSCVMLSGLSGLPSFHEIITWVRNPVILRSILLTGLINTALTVYLETSAMKTLSATETTMLLSTEPIFGSIFASQILGESFGTGGMIGANLILFACILSNLKGSHSQNSDITNDSFQ